MFNYQIGNTPLQARINMPFGVFFLIFFLIILLLVAVFIIFLRINKYHKSTQYIKKLRNRISTPKDIAFFAKTHNLASDDIKLLSQVCKISQCKNLNFTFRHTNNLISTFKIAYKQLLSTPDFDDEKISLFFKLLYQLEQNIAKTRAYDSTKQIPSGTTILYLTEKLEKLPFTLVQNTDDALFVEIPDFLFYSPEKPKVLDRLRFTIKTKEGITYNFVSRLIRYDTSQKDHILMIMSHSDKLFSIVQRHYKRDLCKGDCYFSPIVVNTGNNSSTKPYLISSKKYSGRLSNISAGGCCIYTELPIKEHQYLSIEFPDLNINEIIIGIIKRTRRVTEKTFSIHIQFTKISVKARNKIFESVYKFTENNLSDNNYKNDEKTDIENTENIDNNSIL